MTGLPFPEIDPVALKIGFLQIRWYGLSYLAGFLGGWYYAGKLTEKDADLRPNKEDIDNILPFMVLGVILGGRLGYTLFYNFATYMENPLEILKIWEGGMSFHGGVLGVATVILLYARHHKIHPFALGDIIAVVAPIGLFFGRIANFINGELFGRVTTVPWAVNFPYGGGLPRHPSQLYESFLEGIVLFCVMVYLSKKASIRRTPGVLFGTLLVGYGVSRTIVEYFREPDPHIGLLFDYFTMGQLLSLPMIAIGAGIIFYVRKKHATAST